MRDTCPSLLAGKDGYPALVLTDVVQLSHRMVDSSPPLAECVINTFSSPCAGRAGFRRQFEYAELQLNLLCLTSTHPSMYSLFFIVSLTSLKSDVDVKRNQSLFS